MIVFKTYLKVLNKNKFIIILYTSILLLFAILNINNIETSINYKNTLPNIVIVNNDTNNKLTNNLIKYLNNNSNIIKIDNDLIDDSLFYREIDYSIYIPNNYSKDFIDGNNPQIKVKSSNEFSSNYAQMLLTRYIRIANIYRTSTKNEDELISIINDTLSKEVDIKMNTNINKDGLDKAIIYYNFISYSILATLIYVISSINSVFNSNNISKRIIISSTSYKKHNMILLLSNLLYSIFIYLLYILISIILLGNVINTKYGLILIINSFIFTITSISLSFLISSIVSNKNLIGILVNIISLGSSFICGVFVPLKWLPKYVINIAKLLPTYYYVKTNEYLTNIEVFSINNIKPLIINGVILLSFAILFIILSLLFKTKKDI